MSTFGPSPREAPLTYPGTPPEVSGLITPDAFLPFESLGPRRLTQACLLVDEDGPPAVVDLALTHVTLRDVLRALDAAPMEARVPVLALGSNASPAQLRTKFREAGTSGVVPLTWATVTGVRVGVGAMISRWGYVPAAPVFDPDATSRLAVIWLDADELRAVDETETGYQRRPVGTGAGSGAGSGAEPGSTSVRLESGEVLDDCGVYVSRPGLIAAPGTERPLDLPSQKELIEHLLAHADAELRDLAGGTVDGFVAAAADDDVRARLCEIMTTSANV